MMSESLRRQNASMAAFLHARAVASTHRRIVADIVLGVTVVILALSLRPPAWVFIAGIGACFASYGLWAIAERTLSIDRKVALGTRKRSALVALRGLMTVVGVIALMILVAAVVAGGLGTWIS